MQLNHISEYQSLADLFQSMVAECKSPLWEILRSDESLIGKALGDFDSPEGFIYSDVCAMVNLISKADGDPPICMARLYGAISAALIPGNSPPEMDDYGFQAELFTLLGGWQDNDWTEPFALQCLAEYDQVHGTQLAQHTASVYSMFLSEASAIMDSHSGARLVIDRYRNSLKQYLGLEESYIDASLDDDEGNSQPTYLDSNTCTKCVGAYEILDLPFGAGVVEVRRAQLELARNVVSESLVKKDRQRISDGQLNQINAACDHLFMCRLVSAKCLPAEVPSPATGHPNVCAIPRSNLVRVKPALVEVLCSTETTSARSHNDSKRIVPRSPATGHEQFLGRVSIVFLRSLWRFAKILLATLMVSVAAIIVLIGICATLSRYWEGQRSGQKHQVDRGLLDSGILSFLEAVTWVPRQIWGGLMLIVTPLVLVIAFAGVSFASFVSSNLAACVVLASLVGFGILAWAFHKEWQAEFPAAAELQ